MTVADPTTTVAWTVPALRARAAQDRVEELRPQLNDEVAKRDRAVREAVDNGVKLPELARVLGLTRQTLYGILGTDT